MAKRAEGEAAPQYEVLSSQQFQQMTRGGTFRTVYRVSIRTVNGSTGEIDIQEKDWNADRIRELLDEFAATLDLPFTVMA